MSIKYGSFILTYAKPKSDGFFSKIFSMGWDDWDRLLGFEEQSSMDSLYSAHNSIQECVVYLDKDKDRAGSNLGPEIIELSKYKVNKKKSINTPLDGITVGPGSESESDLNLAQYVKLSTPICTNNILPSIIEIKNYNHNHGQTHDQTLLKYLYGKYQTLEQLQLMFKSNPNYKPDKSNEFSLYTCVYMGGINPDRLGLAHEQAHNQALPKPVFAISHIPNTSRYLIAYDSAILDSNSLLTILHGIIL